MERRWGKNWNCIAFKIWVHGHWVVSRDPVPTRPLTSIHIFYIDLVYFWTLGFQLQLPIIYQNFFPSGEGRDTRVAYFIQICLTLSVFYVGTFFANSCKFLSILTVHHRRSWILWLFKCKFKYISLSDNYFNRKYDRLCVKIYGWHVTH